MAARTSKTELHEKWREKIRVSMLLNRLRNHVLGRIDMSPTQLRAAEILLKKTMPDLASVEHKGEIEHKYVARTPEVIVDTDAWKQQYAPTSLQ